MNNVFCFGTSGGCLDAFYLLKEIYNDEREIFFLSDQHIVGEKILGHKVAGSFEYVSSSKTIGCEFIFQCGSVENHRKRHIWFRKAIESGMVPTTLISSQAYVHKTATIGRGSIIYPGVKIMTNVEIGENCIILPNTVINHDVHVGDYSIINSACVLNGGVELGHNCYVGSGSSFKENSRVMEDTTIGMCSLVLNTLEVTGLYLGSPAKLIR